MNTPTDTSSPAVPQPSRRAYETPSLRVYGSVTSITAANSKTGGQKDGGPNNIKT